MISIPVRSSWVVSKDSKRDFQEPAVFCATSGVCALASKDVGLSDGIPSDSEKVFDFTMQREVNRELGAK